MSAADIVLEASHVAKSYLSGTRMLQVLRDVSLTVRAGESVSVRGESGSGKSTLLNALAGLDAIDGGEVRWDGVADLSVGRRGRFLGMVFQSFYLIPEVTALDNVLMAARILGRVGKPERDRARDLIAEVGLADRAEHVPAQLSGGERQRVAVARALMNHPRLLLADEPTGNLDEHTGDSVIELLLRLCRDSATTLVLVTHNPLHATKTDRALLLHEGVLNG